MADVANIEGGGASVSLTIDNARLQQTIDKAKGQMAELVQASAAARQRMKAASKAGNDAEVAGERVVLASLQAREKATMAVVRAVSGGGEGMSWGRGLSRAGRFGRGAVHVAGMLGGEMGTKVAGGLLAFGLAVVKIGEWAERSCQQMIQLDQQSRQAAADYRQMRESGDRIGWLRKQLESAEQDLSKANAAGQHAFWDTTEKEWTDIHNAQSNVQKLRRLLRDAEIEGQTSLSAGEGGFGSAGAKYMSGYSVHVLLEQIAGNTAATAAALHTS
jgi:hypothetical protein